MHFRIVKLRIIPFLLQLKCTQILKKALQNLDFAYKVEGSLHPHNAFYTQSRGGTL